MPVWQFLASRGAATELICALICRTVYTGAACALSIKKMMWSPSRSVASRRSPVSLIRLGMSMAASGSVQRTSRRSPGLMPLSALRVFSAGKGHFNPVRSSCLVVMVAHHGGPVTGRQRHGLPAAANESGQGLRQTACAGPTAFVNSGPNRRGTERSDPALPGLFPRRVRQGRRFGPEKTAGPRPRAGI